MPYSEGSIATVAEKYDHVKLLNDMGNLFIFLHNDCFKVN